MSMDLVTVYTALNPADAQLVRSRLEAAEFHPFLRGEMAAINMAGDAFAAQGVHIEVPADEAEDAKALIKDFFDNSRS